MIIANRLNITHIIIEIFIPSSRFTKNLCGSLLTLICNLRNADAINVITLKFQNIKSFFQFVFAYAKFFLNTSANVDHAFLVKFRFQDIGGVKGLILLFSSIRIKKRSYGRFIKTHLTSNLACVESIFSKRFRSIDLKLSSKMLCICASCSKLIDRHLKIFSNVFLAKTALLEFFYSAKEIATMLIGAVTRTPRISTRSSLNAIMHQNIVCNRIHS